MGRKPMTEEEKAEFNAKMAAARAAKKAEKTAEAETISVPADDVMGVADDGTTTPLTEIEPDLIGETVEISVDEAEESEKDQTVASAAPQPIYQMVTPKDPTVKILYLDSAIANNQIPIGHGRVITGSGRIFSVALSEFEGEFMTPLTMQLIDQRKFIILDGLTQEQREQYNCDYKTGEVLKKEGIFDYLISCKTEEAVRIFSNLCTAHRELVGTRILTAWENGDNRITRDKLEGLNAISKGDYPDNKGIFTQIIQELNEQI